jgi:hypothetical protein
MKLFVAHDMRVAIVAVWLVVSSILLFILIVPFVLSEDAILTASGSLQAPHQGHERCILCGMTRSFIAISRGHPAQALFFNRHSIILYILFVLDEFFVGIFLAGRMRKIVSSPRFGIHFRNAIIKK